MIRLFSKMFSILEKIIVKLNKWEHIPGSQNQMIYINPQIYEGKDLLLGDGTNIKSGDLVGEIHIDNIKVARINNDLRTIYRLLNEELKALAWAINNDDSYRNIKAFYGRTLLYPLVKKQGFTIIDINKTFGNVMIGFWENILRVVFNKNIGKNKKIFRNPKECWISRNQILSKFTRKGNSYEETMV